MEKYNGYLLTGGNLFFIESAHLELVNNGNDDFFIVPTTHADLAAFLNFVNDNGIRFFWADTTHKGCGVDFKVDSTTFEEIRTALLEKRPSSPFVDATK